MVTGAGSGIGLATTLCLARAGFRTWGLVPDDAEAAQLHSCAGRDGLEVTVVVADLSDPAQRRGLLSRLDLYGLVNNAGFMNAGLLRDVDLDDARRQLEAMVVAPLDLTRQALPAMLARSQGRIIDVTSSALHATTPFTGWYAASKAALRQLTDALRVELAGTGVDVVDIEPGGVSTNIWGRAGAELRQRQAGSGRPHAYDLPLGVAHHFSGAMSPPRKVAAAVLDALTAGRPRAHIRVGKDAVALRIFSEVVPDAIADRIAARSTGGS